MNNESNIRRRLVIPDIHGCYSTFQSLLEKIQLKEEDNLFLLGDYINRGPRSREVLDLIINLKVQGYNISPLRGNHEQMLLDSNSNSEFQNTRIILPGIRKPPGLYSESNRLLGKYADTLKALPYYVELDSFLLVHAGFNTTIEDPFTDTESMMWIDRFEYDPMRLKGKHVIHGHTPVDIDEIFLKISNRSMIIPLDNGVYKTSYEQKGNLVCLDIDRMELIIQKNIDKQSRE